MKKQTNEKAFTILELLLVIVAIAILATLIITTYAGIREKERNSQRQNNIVLLQGKLELYYDGGAFRYPSLSEINDPVWRSKNLKNFDDSILRDPSSATKILVAHPEAHAIAYIVTASDGSACDNTATHLCTQYALTATLEGGGTYTKSSLN